MRRNNFESGVSYAQAEEDIFEKDAKEREASSLEQYWKRFGFRGNAPKPGSPLEDRLRHKCQEYIDMVLDPMLSGALGQDRRRELHNEIAIMATGKSREQMDYQVGEKVSEFASLVVTGMTLGKALADFERNRKQSA